MVCQTFIHSKSRFCLEINPIEKITNGKGCIGKHLNNYLNLILNILEINHNDLSSHIEMWILLEVESAKIAAQRRTEHDILSIKKALDNYAEKILLGEQGITEDLKFHLKIADASKNSILKSLIEILRPNIFNNPISLKIYSKRLTTVVLNEHKKILNTIIAQESEAAAQAMQSHLKSYLESSS